MFEGYTISAGDPFTPTLTARREISHSETFTRDDGTVYLVVYHRKLPNPEAWRLIDPQNWA